MPNKEFSVSYVNHKWKMVFCKDIFFYGKLFWKFLCIVWNKINFWRLNLGACFWSSCHTFHWNFTTFLLLWSLKGFNYMKSFICPQNEFRSLSMLQWIRVFTPLIYVLNCVVISASFLVDQCLLVASSLLHQRKLIYPKSSALHDLRYVITLTREHWLWLGYITDYW